MHSFFPEAFIPEMKEMSKVEHRLWDKPKFVEPWKGITCSHWALWLDLSWHAWQSLKSARPDSVQFSALLWCPAGCEWSSSYVTKCMYGYHFFTKRLYILLVLFAFHLQAMLWESKSKKLRFLHICYAEMRSSACVTSGGSFNCSVMGTLIETPFSTQHVHIKLVSLRALSACCTLLKNIFHDFIFR